MQALLDNFLANPQYYILGALTIAEVITRLTPTKKDDGFVQRIGVVITSIFDNIKVPNRKKG